ncbi:MFS general substrate transporter [Cylindrobasidium torrendii FP15055 ss-10]|uniref:Lysosomal dipeptide transporter MFSD1 n=1 Tax=Cylindrobasidium torrendii FP15055 ss-10 TaxID=1314674 RepID=A0A0D7BQM6_9AGAR|nr:MFS general substrate transporter [Cylindrobasidium torrendii FP15055 ss-10]
MIPELPRNGPADADAASINEKGSSTEDVDKTPSDVEATDVETSTIHSIHDFPWTWKVTALVLGLLLSAGSSFSENTLGPLKSTFKKELGITNAQYGAISSATSLVNTILPIIGGFILDYYGICWGSMLSSVFIFLGATISAAGSNAESFTLVIVGRIVLGFGSTVIESAGSKILAHWFQHRGLAFVYGLDIAWGKIIVLIAKATAVPMRDSAFWGWALWIPAIVCFVNLLENLVFVYWTTRVVPEWARMPTGRSKSGGARVLPRLDALAAVPWMFWLIVCSQLLQAGVVGGFNGLSADIITQTRGSTDEIAGYTSALQQVIPIFMVPCLGLFFDRVGFRMFFVSFTSLLWIVVYSLLGFSSANALGVMILASFAQSFNAIPFTCSIPLLVPEQTELGLTFGIWKAFNNAGSVIVDMVAGRLQDITADGGYHKVISFFVAMKAIEFCLGAFYGILDRKYLAGILTMSETRRLALHKTGIHKKVDGRQPKKVFTSFGLGLLATVTVIAWVLYIKYSL